MTADIWINQPLLAFDLESTGINPETDRIATACAAVVHNGAVSYQREWMIAIDVDMPAEASRVNKLTTERLRAEGRPAADVIPEIVNALRYAVTNSMPIVAYNGSFDLTFMNCETWRWLGRGLVDLLGAPLFPVLDPFVVWKAVDRRKGKRRLVEACEAFDVALGENAHEAAVDAVAAVRVMVALARRFRLVSSMDLPRLHEAQIEWRREQQVSLRRYFDSQGKAHDGCDPSWPMREFVTQPVDGAVPL